MISKQTSFVTTDGQLFVNIEGAQKHELEKFLGEGLLNQETETTADVVATVLLHHKEEIVDLLTMKATSRPKARKVNGASRKKKSAAAAENAALQDAKQ